LNNLFDEEILLAKKTVLARFADRLAFQRLTSVLIVRELRGQLMTLFNDNAVDALVKSLKALGRNDDDWNVFVQDASLNDDDFVTIVEEIDPSILITLDRSSGFRVISLSVHRDFVDSACPTSNLESLFQEPIIEPLTFFAEGRFCVAFEDFEALLDDASDKQRAWHTLKRLKQQ
jgi:hypothetical protein